MDVADRIFVMANGQVEQEGSPDELYDKPANDFVMSFLGPATRLDGHLVRPHDVEVLPAEQPGAVRAHITRIVRLGFEVRVELIEEGAAETDDRSVLAAAVDAAESTGSAPLEARPGSLWAQLTREELQRLRVGVGDAVFVRPNGKASLAKAG
jgi:sulfate transport system ATP-binding protein